MSSFSNAKTQVPEQFQNKIDIDNKIQELYHACVTKNDNVLKIEEWERFKEKRAELKIQQDLARYSCAKSIERAKGHD